ncbi:hypothetical protein Tco_1203089 [Tanacetum coccineum]
MPTSCRPAASLRVIICEKLFTVLPAPRLPKTSKIVLNESLTMRAARALSLAGGNGYPSSTKDEDAI